MAPNLIGNISDSDNSGNENGGGVYLTGANTRLTIIDGNIVGNKTGGHGGAIAAENDATVSIQRSSSRCWNPAHCVFFSANKAGEQNFGAGGAIFNSSATVTIKQATFEDNRADFGTVIYATGLNSTTTINSSIFNHNGAGGGNSGANGFSDNYVIRALSDAVVHVLSSTIADNDVTLSVIGISASTTASSTVYSSIIYDAASGPVFALGSTGYLTDCDLVHETGSFLSSGTSSVGNPMFVNSASRNYHIQVSSPAVDGCDNFTHASDISDIDNESRGYDDPNHANTIGSYDIGADETLESDIIFKHGFEL